MRDTLNVPDPEDEPWPDGRYLRQGVRANGWLLLETVSLGYELWAKQELEDAKAEPAPAATSKPQKPAKGQPEDDGTKAVSDVMKAGMKAIRGASTPQQLEAVGQRLVARHEAGDLTDDEQQALLQLMLDRETELSPKY